MSYDTLSYEVTDGIATITLDRAEMMNAFAVQMCHDLIAVLEAADTDDAVRAVIVTGAGRAFCAGMDLSVEGNVFGLDETIDPMGPEAARIRDTGGQVTLRIFRMKKPVIGAINGAAIGIGATMTLPMDARVLSTKARIGFVFARIGICMEACSSWFLPRLVGMETALDWALSGEILSAEEAHTGGYARHLVAPEDLMAKAGEIAARFAQGNSALSLASNRQLLWRMSGAAHPMEAHRIESRAMLDLSMGDGKEGVAAFNKKRPPTFAGRPSSDMPRGFDWNGEPPFD